MKRSAFITSVSSDIKLPNTQVENLVNYRLRKEKCKPPIIGIDHSYFFKEYEAITTYSTQVVTKGEVRMCLVNNRRVVVERYDLPVAASFFVTCIMGAKGRFKVGITTSLS
jgi:hypothetical protein